jgi:hypothetical protein
MQDSGIPAKFPIPWANGAGSGFIRAVPQASQIGAQNGAASLTDGFPPNCFIPIAGGGSWPWGQDFNGILNLITKWQQWNQAGAPITYDAAFQAAIGGYPKGAHVGSATIPGVLWQSSTDNNTTNPDTGGAGWSVITLVDPNTAGLIITGSSASGAGIRLIGNGATTPNKSIRAVSGTLQIINSAYTAAILSLDDAGNLSSLRNVAIAGDYTGVNATLGGSVAASGNVSAGNVVTAGNALQAGNSMSPTASNGHEWVFYDSAGDHIQQFRSTWYDRWEGATGIRRWAAPSGYIMTLDGSGNLTVGGAFNAGGNVVANGGRLRAGFGAINSGDPNAATLLGDFTNGLGGPATNDGWYRRPDGIIEQWVGLAAPAGGGLATTTYNVFVGFPNAFVGAICSFLGNSPPGAGNPGSIAVEPINNSQFQITTNFAPAQPTVGIVVHCVGY